jgi:hypothetical protein
LSGVTLEAGEFPTYYNVDEVTTKLGISRSLFDKLCRAGKGPVLTRLGTRRIIAKGHLEEWLVKRAQRSEATLSRRPSPFENRDAA